MDALDRLFPSASELLKRSDGVLARAGAPEGHEILRLLRLTGRLPADLVAAVVVWRPAPLLAQADLLTRQAGQHRDLAGVLEAPIPWEGMAANAFGARLTVVIRQCDELAGSASSLATHLTDLAAWVDVARLRLAKTLASVLSSTEAVTLASPMAAPLELAEAALRIGTAVLRDAELFHRAGKDFAASWPGPVIAVSQAGSPAPAGLIRADGLA